MSRPGQFVEIAEAVGQGRVAVEAIQDSTDAPAGDGIEHAPMREEVGSVEGLVLMRHDAFEICQRAQVVADHKVRLDVVLSQNRIDIGPLVALGQVGVDGREGLKTSTAGREYIPGHAGD